MNPEQYAVYVQDACKSYGQREVLKKLCMRVDKGTIYGLLGASGCGKTTLLSAIVGRKEVNSGTIYTLGGKPGDRNSGVPGRRVGYMPQNIALVAEFTVKDAVYYFGRITNLETHVIEKRFNDLSTLLDLPPENRCLKNCSGGQQRRVSFAAAIVHMPELLILDEPTAGVDPLVRERIWNYLVEITQEHRIAVIITTHYIDEAKQANKIGLMREGRLLAEESPQTLLRLFQKDTLEDVFLILSMRQEEGRLGELGALTDAENNSVVDFNGSTTTMSTFEMGHGSTDMLTKKELPKTIKKCYGHFDISKHRLKALFDKNWKQFYRNIAGAIFLFLFPAVQTICFFIAIGGDIRSIPLAVVNDESMNSICPNFTLNKTITLDSEQSCHFKDMSCRFLKYLDHPMIETVDYSSLPEALEDVRHGKVVGVMYMAENFTESFEDRINEGKNVDAEVLDFSEIKVWMDMSNRQIGATVKYKLIDLYLDFQKDVFIDCNYLTKVADIPVNFDNYLYGDINEPYIVFMVPAVLLTIVNFMGALLTALTIITERFEGIWDRSIVAGVTSFEVTITHFALQACVCVFQVIEVIVIAFVVFKMEYKGSIGLIWLFLYIQAIAGMSYGFWVSSVSINYSMANIITTGSFMPMILICGYIWPLESMPKFLQFISRCLPFTISIESLRNVIKKGWTISEFQVWIGLLIPAIWTVSFIALSLYTIKKRR